MPAGTYEELITCAQITVGADGSASVSITNEEEPVFAICQGCTCGEAPIVTATDNCSSSLSVNFNEIIGSGCPYTITRTWEVVDNEGWGLSDEQRQVASKKGLELGQYTNAPNLKTCEVGKKYLSIGKAFYAYGLGYFGQMISETDGLFALENTIYEHHFEPRAVTYKDVLELWGNSNVGYTPTLIVNYGGLNGEYYWYQKTNVWKNKKLLKYMPRAIVDSRSRHRTMVPDEEYDNGHILVSKTAKDLTDAGVKVNLGANGQLQGLGAHWELWLLQQGGMTNHEALKAATINGADYLGMSNDIGSIKKGKLADLIVLDKNPLEDIKNSESVIYTMVNGRLYDTETMNEIGNSQKERGKFYWENSKYNQAFPWHERI